VVHCDVYNDVFDLLREEYLYQIGQIGRHSYTGSHLGNPDDRLAAHLVTMYWRGRLPLDDVLLESFFAKAPDRVRAHAIEFVGRSLRNDTGDVAEEILVRLRAFWASRLAAARAPVAGGPFVEELSRFGWWFASGKFADGWAIDQLIEALKIAQKAEPDHLMVERLTELSSSMPRKVVECLAMLVAGDKEGWNILGWRQSAHKILECAIHSGDHNAAAAAAALIHKLGARGYFEFRSLLPLSA
jgi:hypothetical protein